MRTQLRATLCCCWEAFTSNDADTNLQDENIDGKILKRGRGRRNSEMLIKRSDEDVAADILRQLFMSASVNKKTFEIQELKGMREVKVNFHEGKSLKNTCLRASFKTCCNEIFN